MRALLAICAMVAASNARAEDFGGLRIGMTEADAWTALGATGTPKRSPLNAGNGSTLLYNDDYNAAICRGRVFSITHRLDPTFIAWTREVRVAKAARGAGEMTANSTEGVNRMSSVRASWTVSPGVTYDIGYYEMPDQKLATETIWKRCT